MADVDDLGGLVGEDVVDSCGPFGVDGGEERALVLQGVHRRVHAFVVEKSAESGSFCVGGLVDGARRGHARVEVAEDRVDDERRWLGVVVAWECGVRRESCGRSRGPMERPETFLDNMFCAGGVEVGGGDAAPRAAARVSRHQQMRRRRRGGRGGGWEGDLGVVQDAQLAGDEESRVLVAAEGEERGERRGGGGGEGEEGLLQQRRADLLQGRDVDPAARERLQQRRQRVRVKPPQIQRRDPHQKEEEEEEEGEEGEEGEGKEFRERIVEAACRGVFVCVGVLDV